MVCTDRFETLHFVLVDCPAEEVFFMYYTELIGLQKNMNAVVSVSVIVHVKTSIYSYIFLFTDIQIMCISTYMCAYLYV